MKTLLLSYSYEPLNFINLKRTIKLYVNQKIDVVSWWDERIRTAESYIDYPSVIRLKRNIKILRQCSRFNRTAVFRRDIYICQYCGEQVTSTSATLDHILPVSKGGKNDWLNCVTSCFPCNSKKKDRTPEEAGFELINSPYVPYKTINNDYKLENPKHPDWEMFFKGRNER